MEKCSRFRFVRWRRDNLSREHDSMSYTTKPKSYIYISLALCAFLNVLSSCLFLFWIWICGSRSWHDECRKRIHAITFSQTMHAFTTHILGPTLFRNFALVLRSNFKVYSTVYGSRFTIAIKKIKNKTTLETHTQTHVLQLATPETNATQKIIFHLFLQFCK